MIADMMGKYDTIGIDCCVAMNVNDLICVGAMPLSLVDYIAVERIDAAMLDAIGLGLCEGARQASVLISRRRHSIRAIKRNVSLASAARSAPANLRYRPSQESNLVVVRARSCGEAWVATGIRYREVWDMSGMKPINWPRGSAPRLS
jgi:hypothetical protein